jgi:hypothetical protein
VRYINYPSVPTSPSFLLLVLILFCPTRDAPSGSNSKLQPFSPSPRQSWVPELANLVKFLQHESLVDPFPSCPAVQRSCLCWTSRVRNMPNRMFCSRHGLLRGSRLHLGCYSGCNRPCLYPCLQRSFRYMSSGLRSCVTYADIMRFGAITQRCLRKDAVDSRLAWNLIW